VIAAVGSWNAVCAACHNTRLRKHYLKETDSYQTTMVEMGVGCEACHGPLAGHNAYQLKAVAGTRDHRKDPALERIAREPMFSVCGSCHSRRAELTGDFRPGETFFDHFALTSLIRKNLSLQERIEIVRTMWRMVYSDGKLTDYENYLVRKLADLLGIEHHRMIEAKVAVLRERGEGV